MSYQPRHRSVTNSLARVLLAAMVALLLAGSLGPLAVGVSAQVVVPELTDTWASEASEQSWLSVDV